VNKKRLISEMKAYFGGDKKRIDHALRVLGFAEKILERENGNPDIVVPAAIFHDIGIHEAEKKYGSNAGKYQEMEGPPIARRILRSSGISESVINEVCEIIAHHHSPGKVNTQNFRALFDADWLVNLPDEYDIKNKKNTEKTIEKLFLTKTGREIARAMFL